MILGSFDVFLLAAAIIFLGLAIFVAWWGLRKGGQLSTALIAYRKAKQKELNRGEAMTNKLMLSVELRELLVRINNLHATGNDIDIEMKELGALLDRPETPYVPKAGWSFKYAENGVIVIRNGKDWMIIKPGDGPIYEQFLYRFCEEQLNKTAAQHHGDPMAVEIPEHTMRSVMDAIQQARGFPALTSNQCHALAESLNYVARLNGVKP